MGTGLIISALCGPPRHAISKEQFSTFFKTFGPKFFVGSDFNSKHTYISFGSRVITPKGRNLLKTISPEGYNILSTGKPAYWTLDPNRLPDMLDSFVSKELTNSYTNIEECLDPSSDHTPLAL